MIKRFFILIFVFYAVNLLAQDNKVKRKPSNLEEAVAKLQEIHHDTLKQKIKQMTEDDFIARSHMGIGMWIRNNWGLWKGGPLKDYFNSIGINHPDDMSSIVLRSYHRTLNDKPWELESQVKFYQDYWKAKNEHIEKLKTDTNYLRQVKEAQDSMLLMMLELKKKDWKIGTPIRGYVKFKCEFFVNLTEIEGVIQEWKNDKIVLKITKYIEPGKKKGVVKCNNVIDGIFILEDYSGFKKVE